MMTKTALDATDQKLLSLLRENARTSTAELARGLGLSRTTVQSRIERLERGGVVAGYTVKLADEVEAGLVRTYVLITLAPRQTLVIQAALRGIPAVRTLHSVSGPFDLLAILAAGSIGELDAVIDRIGQMDGVERTMSAIVLSTRFER
jgi:DNA-binding Lrp family transcriptional regulator